MEPLLIFLILAVIVTYIYAFVSGFTDAANAIATSVGTRALTPTQAIVMAGVLELAGALTGTAVALTIGKGIIDVQLVTLGTVVAALLVRRCWSLFTYNYGIPVSETHGLVGAMVGAGIASAGIDAIVWSGVTKVLLAIILSPLLGFFAGIAIMAVIHYTCSSAPSHKMKRLFLNLQRLSSAFMAFSHGQNDAQKPMGILVLVLALYTGTAATGVPLWVILSVGLVAALGVAYGGWRIIRTLGLRVTSLSPAQGFAAETSAAGVLQIASSFGVPVSTTHTIASSIFGAGAAKRKSSVRWGIVFEILLSWVLTLPVTIALGWAFTHAIGFVGA